jgi:hypothetical protein
MLQGTPSHELDRIIDAATAAQATLRKMLDGMEPDENGVVTVTTEAAAAAASGLYEELAHLIDVGMGVAGTVEDLHPATAAATVSLQNVTERLQRRLDRDSVGHAVGELAVVEEEATADDEDGSVAVEITPADAPPSYYGV